MYKLYAVNEKKKNINSLKKRFIYKYYFIDRKMTHLLRSSLWTQSVKKTWDSWVEQILYKLDKLTP